MTHGTRQTYRHGCRCTPCRAANAEYLTSWRRQRQSGTLPLGALIPAVEARRLLLLIQKEHYAKLKLADALGWGRNLARHRQQPRIRLRTLLKVRRFYRLHIAEGDPSTLRTSDAGSSWVTNS